MAKKSEKKEVKKPKAVKKIDPELVRKDYVLEVDLVIGDKSHKKGDKVALTEKGAKFFKSKNYIK